MTVTQQRLREDPPSSVLRPQDVATTNDLNMDTTKTEALWLITTKSIAGELEFDTRVVKPGVLAPMF